MARQGTYIMFYGNERNESELTYPLLFSSSRLHFWQTSWQHRGHWPTLPWISNPDEALSTSFGTGFGGTVTLQKRGIRRGMGKRCNGVIESGDHLRSRRSSSAIVITFDPSFPFLSLISRVILVPRFSFHRKSQKEWNICRKH